MPPASSRFKISKPTLQSSSGDHDSQARYDYGGGGSNSHGNDGPYPSVGGPSQWSGAQSSSRSNGSSLHQSHPSQSSPTRPARSRARGQPSVDIPPVRAAALQRKYSTDDRIPSPTTPTTPDVSIPRPRDSPGDPWAADRTQRSQARQQTGDSAKSALVRPGEGSERLRNLAAEAFMSAPKQKREEPAVKRPPRPRRAQPADQWDDRVGATGGRFAEVDGVFKT